MKRRIILTALLLLLTGCQKEAPDLWRKETLNLEDCPGRILLSCLISCVYSLFTLGSKPYGLGQSVNYFDCFDGGYPIVTAEVTHPLRDSNGPIFSTTL